MAARTVLPKFVMSPSDRPHSLIVTCVTEPLRHQNYVSAAQSSGTRHRLAQLFTSLEGL